MSHHQYVQWERGHEEPAVSLGLPKLVLTDNEWCTLMRRRSGLRLMDVAASLGRCKYWVNCMESGTQDCAELVEYWKSA